MVSQGELAEMAAADILYKELCYTDDDDRSIKDDRYIHLLRLDIYSKFTFNLFLD